MDRNHRARPAWRRLAMLATVAMVVALVPTVAFADHVDPQNDVCPPPPMFDEQDVDFDDHEGTTHEHNIECVAQYGIAQGFGDDTYRPAANVTRAQMATFIGNLIRTSGAELPAGDDEFDDIDGNTHEDNIDALAAAGVVVGTGGGNYSPGNFVTRAQMASFIAQAIDYVDNGEVDGSLPPPASDDHFDDIDGNTHQDNINRIAEPHIVLGVSDTEYDPARDTTRGQMATFIMNAASYLNDEGLWNPPLLTDPGPTAPTEVTATSNTDDGGITVTWDDSSSENVESYNIYRADAIAPIAGGGPHSCPAAVSDDYTIVGNVSAEDDNEFHDTSAVADERYCYYVTAVDDTGNEGPPSVVVGPTVAAEAAGASDPVFQDADASLGASTVTVVYDQDIDCDTVDADGSNYDVDTTILVVTLERTVGGAVCVDAVDGESDTIEISFLGLNLVAGEQITVTAIVGDDGDTVLDPDGNAQPVGDSVTTAIPLDA